ncbi:MAG: hypothetical protein IKP64_02660, partial [Selenomonadaceae bacterium]|nr:hypothetical protein [Selenomonadaceae bacterium]
MDKDIAGINLPMAIGFAALIDLLAEKGVITEAEYEKKFEEAKKSSHGFGYRRNEEKIVGVTDLETKISKALYELLKELYQSRAAKEFVDAYEREEQVREWSSEDFDYWLKLTDSVRRKMFPDHVCDAYEHEQRHEKQARETPKNGEV